MSESKKLIFDTTFSIITLVAVIMLWAATTELDNVTRGAGKTISEAQNQLV